MEYLFIMGFVLLLLAPLLLVYYNQANRLDEETSAASLERAATQIAEAADTVYYLGAPSMRTLTVDFPDSIESVTIDGRDVVFRVASSHGAYDQVATSVANLTGAISTHEGIHVLVFQALPDSRVNITEGG